MGFVRLVILILLSLGVVACGGGGGGGGGTTSTNPLPGNQPPPPRNPPPVIRTNPCPGAPDDCETREYTVFYRAYDANGNPVPDGNGNIDRTDRHLELVKASAAYARGATGSGETVLVVDTGLAQNHREFVGGFRKSELVLEAGYNDYTVDAAGHGTAVAAVIAAYRHGGEHPTLDMHGVAFDARVKMLAIKLGRAGEFYAPFDFAGYNDDRFANDFRSYLAAATGDIAIINFSFNAPGSIDRYSQSEIGKVVKLREVLAQSGTPDADKKLIVWAAGNAGNKNLRNGTSANADSPEWTSGLGIHFPELRGHILTVVAVDQDGEIADFSNRCGTASSFCLAAPGVAIMAPLVGERVPATDNAYGPMNGTSFAAPIVSGALALLRQHYRGQMGNTELVARLLETADKTGTYANTAIYGQGLLDLDAATRPSGSMMMSASATPGAPRYAVDSSVLALAPAFGDALSSALGGREIAAFDDLNAPFFLPMETFLGTAPRPTPWSRLRAPPEPSRVHLPGGGRLQLQSGGTATTPTLSLTRPIGGGGSEMFLSHGRHPASHFGTGAAASVLAGEAPGLAPWPALAQDGLVLGMGAGSWRAALFGGRAQWGEQRDSDTGRAFGALGEWRWNADAARRSGEASLQAGYLREDARLLGTRARGGFGALQSRTWFGGVTAQRQFDRRWSGTAAAHIGLSRPRLSQSDRLLSSLTPLWSSSFSAELTGRNLWMPRDRAIVRISQPHRVESGTAQLRWARGRTRYGDLLMDEARVSLAPSARQVDVELAYSRPLGAGELHLAGMASYNPSHAAGAPTEYAVLLGYRLDF